MPIFLKKSKIILLCIIPAYIILAVFSDLIVTIQNISRPVQNSNKIFIEIGLFPSLIMTLLIFSIYLYIGFIFLKNKRKFIYKLFGFINLFWFVFKILSTCTHVLIPNISFSSNILLAIFNIVVIIFQVIDIYLIVTYNYHSEK